MQKSYLKQPLQFHSLEQLQPVLFDMYRGSSVEFKNLKCPNCQLLAVEPMDCGHCGESICEPCRNNPFQKNCQNCNTSLLSVAQPSKTVLRMFDSAKFQCPNDCGRFDLAYKDLLWHVKTECKNRVIDCPNMCGQKIKVMAEARHK